MWLSWVVILSCSFQVYEEDCHASLYTSVPRAYTLCSFLKPPSLSFDQLVAVHLTPVHCLSATCKMERKCLKAGGSSYVKEKCQALHVGFILRPPSPSIVILAAPHPSPVYCIFVTCKIERKHFKVSDSSHVKRIQFQQHPM